MNRWLVFFLVLGAFISCTKNEDGSSTPDIIPNVINGVITEFTVTPLDINTPDKGTFFISANNTNYKVDFDAVAKAESNAILMFESDTILIDESREFANLGQDAIAYHPVAENEISILFDDGRKVDGL